MEQETMHVPFNSLSATVNISASLANRLVSFGLMDPSLKGKKYTSI